MRELFRYEGKASSRVPSPSGVTEAETPETWRITSESSSLFFSIMSVVVTPLSLPDHRGLVSVVLLRVYLFDDVSPTPTGFYFEAQSVSVNAVSGLRVCTSE